MLFDSEIIILENFNLSNYQFSCNILRNYLSDFFYMLFICLLSHYYVTLKISKIYISILFLSPFVHEILQYYFIKLGTFDIYDVVLYFCVSLSYYLFIYRNYAH